jgi:hypothetical protein
MNKTGKALLSLIFLLIIIGGLCYVVYNNKDFQRSHKKEIAKINFYLRDYIKTYKDFTKDFDEKIAEWRKSHPRKQHDAAAKKPLETWTFDEMILEARAAEKEIPSEMIRHQNDEITICSFNADFLINNPLSDKEAIHLANVMRFCELSVMTNLRNEISLKKIVTALKVLRYNATYENVVAPKTEGANTTSYIYLYRDDKIQSLQKSSLFKETNSLPIIPAYGLFKAGEFDFMIAIFATPPSGTALKSVHLLEEFSETLKTEYPDTQDLVIFGDFSFESRGLIWDRSSLLPTIARALPATQAPLDLLGNFWFRKSELTEFNGKSGVININPTGFPSKSKPPLSADKPIWVQFKLMPDDD